MLLSLVPVLSLLLTLTPSAAVPTELQGTGMSARHAQAAAAPRPASEGRALQRRQATRSGILARQKRSPAKRQQSSPLPLLMCADSNLSGTESYAVYTGGYPPVGRTFTSTIVRSQQECNIACSANSRKHHSKYLPARMIYSARRDLTDYLRMREYRCKFAGRPRNCNLLY